MQREPWIGIGNLELEGGEECELGGVRAERLETKAVV
jgi:hypothetical protein